MHLSSDYDVFIFDCDGVILDSNQLKLNAMENALGQYPVQYVQSCLDYFSKNFGRSRYLHVEHFLKNIIQCKPENYQNEYDDILNKYAGYCTLLYKEAEINTGFIEFIQQVKIDKFVASGSDEDELRNVFSERGLDIYFSEIYGSPESKTNNVKKILERGYTKALMFGDALGDLVAAEKNKIDFIFLSELSTAPDLVRESAFFKGNEVKNFSNLLL
ncbi:HAD family hydrolase [Pectobacterium actinidiae]|uniref:phosphoglycolate phosphatase n=1 Tax=Pectobacterium actinidiae TaxID=1507808 RepID=A0ABW8GJK4_9GAMM